jgi:hypothetical protein
MAIANATVSKIFDDLDDFRNFCRFELDRNGNFYPFNEADLYRESSLTWAAYVRFKNYNKAKHRAKGKRN